MRPKWIIAALIFLATLLCNPFCEISAAQNVLPNPNAPKPSPPTISLSPAVIMLKAQPGASSAHELKITNLTYSRLRFALEAQDVVVRDDKRVFVPAGETEGGIARSAIFDPPAIDLDPGQEAQVTVTLTVPEHPAVRAVVALFQGQTIMGSGPLTVTGSLGTLITYNLSSNVAITAGTPKVIPETDSSNLTFSQDLRNTGSEPVVPHGTLAILDDQSGKLIGRVDIEPHRLLPGEKFNCAVEYPSSLKSGDYRAMISFEDEGAVQTSAIKFKVP
jgi:hypothetical protein